MIPTNQAPLPALPRYGIRDDEMTKPGVVLVDWTGDEATVVAQPATETLEHIPELPDEDFYELVDDEELAEDPYDAPETAFAPRWQGIGRKHGTVALAVTLGVCLAIGLAALFEPSDAQAGAERSTSDLALR